jgi:hypothetical protein
MQSKAMSVKEYLASLPEDRRAALEAVRKVVLANLDKDFQEGMQYGMIGYYLPHSVYPDGYHCDPSQPLPFAGLASQKNHMSIYLMCVYGSPEQEAAFRTAWAKTGKKLDMGKSCIRFKKLDDLALDVVGQTIKRVTAKKYLAHYLESIRSMTAKKNAARKTAAKASAPKKATAKKSAKRAS